MKTFLIILAVLVVLIAIILSLSATITIIYDEKWTTKIKVLWIEKDIKITEILNFVLFPEKKAEQVKTEQSVKKEKKKKSKKDSDVKKETTEPVIESKTEVVTETKSECSAETVTVTETVTKTETPTETITETVTEETKTVDDNKKADNKTKSSKKQKPNYIKSLWDKEGIVGMMDLVSNLLQSVSSAVGTLFRGFHIHSLYVKIIVGGYDAAEVALAYGTVCKYYYPLKGVILNGMKVDNYDDMIMPDYIAPMNEYGLQFIGSISVGTLLKVVLSAAKTFVINIIKK